MKATAFTSLSIFLAKAAEAEASDHLTFSDSEKIMLQQPVVISTWNHGIAANDAAWKKLSMGYSALDAVEAGVKVTESDPTNRSVGLGGLPDRDGRVTLDACIMNHESECGAVGYLQDIENPISVARKVMEDPPHVMLVGDGCTTSGWAYKLPGRLGDSPLIGAGLFVDNEVGGACATGMGEAVIRIAGSHTVVELMRQGKSPQEACKIAVKRIQRKHKDLTGLQVGFIALNKNGEVGGYSVYAGFNYALMNKKDNNVMIDAGYDLAWN